VANPLADALEAKDNVAIALALRNDGVVVPVLEVEGGDPVVRVFGVEGSDKYSLLLFSSPEAYAAMIPDEDAPASRVYSGQELLAFIRSNLGVLEVVWIDIASPHATQAGPGDIMAALELPGA
jgi:hypothetical protein